MPTREEYIESLVGIRRTWKEYTVEHDKFSKLGLLNLASWMGERMGNALQYIDYLESENKRIRDALIAALDEVERLRKAQRWIPVGERLPWMFRNVLARNLVETYICTLWQDGTFHDRETFKRIYDVIEWRELPAPPEAQ